MASSSSHHGIPLATLLEWLKIRDVTFFFGRNCVSQNIPLTLELASTCQHPNALWLTAACAGKDVNTKEDAKQVFSGPGKNDARKTPFFRGCSTHYQLLKTFQEQKYLYSYPSIGPYSM
jgi:hypothetical protein